MDVFIKRPSAGIEATIANHFIMLFRDVLDKAFNKVHNGKSFFHILVIFVAVVMKGHKVTIIAVNSGGGNNRASKITANIFENSLRVTFSRLGVNIKALFMLPVTAGLDRFKGGPDALFHFIKKSGTESITEEVEIKMCDITPKAVIAKAAFGNETVDMRVPFEIPAEGM